MLIYQFQFRGTPTKGSPEFGVLAGALIHAWVYADNQDEAQASAAAAAKIMDFAWRIDSLEQVAQLTPDELPPHLGKLESADTAVQHPKVVLEFVGYPIEERDDESFEIRQVKPYHQTPSDQH